MPVPAPWTRALSEDVNAAGWVVGEATRRATAADGIDAATVTYVVLRRGGTFTDLGAPSGWDSHLAGSTAVADDPGVRRSINDAGQIIGTLLGPSSQEGFRWQNGTMTPLDPPSGRFQPAAINAAGDVAGQIFSPAAVQTVGDPTLWHQGTFTDLFTVFGTTGTVTDVSDTGMIAGFLPGPELWHYTG